MENSLSDQVTKWPVTKWSAASCGDCNEILHISKWFITKWLSDRVTMDICMWLAHALENLPIYSYTLQKDKQKILYI
jgi:hypothetical protein